MGAGNSSLPTSNRTWSLEPPPLPAPPFLSNDSPSGSRITHLLEEMPEIMTNKVKIPSLLHRPEVQVPSYYDSMRKDNCLHRPAIPSSSIAHPSQESLVLEDHARLQLSYTSEASNKMTMEYSIQQERLDWSRTISNLASANQQLATAYSSTLKHLEELYTELKKGNEYRGNRNVDSANTQNVLQQKMEDRFTFPFEELDSEFKSESGRKTSREKRSNVVDEGGGCDVVVRSCGNSDKKHLRRTRVNAGRQAVLVKPGKKKLERLAHRRRQPTTFIRDSGPENDVVHEEELDVSGRLEDYRELELVNLQKEIEDLKTLRSESQMMNIRLMKDLEAQKQTIQKLMEEHETSKRQYEASLTDRAEKIDQVSKQLDTSEKETARLLRELDTFQFEKATADTRISNLEKELRDLRLETERIKREESEKQDLLKMQLNQEISDKQRQVDALISAQKEVEQLKNSISTNSEMQIPLAESGQDVPAPSAMNDIASRLGQNTNDATVVDDEFRKELLLKREARQRAIAAVSSEMDRLRRELDAEKIAHSETSKVLELLKAAQSEAVKQSDAQDSTAVTCDDSHTSNMDLSDKEMSRRIEAIRLTDLLKMSDGLTNEIRCQLENLDDLRYHLENHPDEHRARIHAFTKLGDETREMLKVRYCQINGLKDRLAHILVKFTDTTFLNASEDVRSLRNQHVEDLAKLRRLGEERCKALMELTESAIKESTEVKWELESLKKRHEGVEEELRKAEEKIDSQDNEISSLESQLGLAKADCRDLQNQMSVINSLFTQMLLGASSAEMDLDRLTQLLQENHDLITDMAKGNNTEAAALPKLLLELIEQVDGRSSKGQDEKKEEGDLQQENIAHNLPKVWRVLMELLSCHAAGTSTASASAASSSAPDSCYKSVDTPTGPRLVISVSKTYIRLKELILEKKHLEKEMNRMKQLNNHLESKLVEQEKRLSTVSDELSKTWSIVGRMQAQHQQLHTHEQILRYELQQKRKMLQELKQELEYCREKWESARQKNTNTEIEWRSLRREFAARKALSCQVDSFNSGESGFSDERDDETDEEDVEGETAVGKRIRMVGARRRIRKDDSRAFTPDTESEQPTDNELSESKTISSATSEQRASTPEIELESSMTDVVQSESDIVSAQSDICTTLEPEIMDPLDRALTNVIKNLIKMDDSSYSSIDNTKQSSTRQTNPEEKCILQLECSSTVNETNSETWVDKSEKEALHECEQRVEVNQETYVEKGEREMLREFEGKGKEENVSLSNCNTVENMASLDSDKSDDILMFNTEPESKDQFQTISVFSIGPDLKTSSSTVENLDHDQRYPSFFGCSLPNKKSQSGPIFSGINTAVASDATEKEKKPGICTETMIEADNVSLDSCSSADTVTESPLNGSNGLQASMIKDSSAKEDVESTEVEVKEKCSGIEDNLDARAARLKRLEEQAEWLVKKMSATNRRGSVLSNRLEELHEVYGAVPTPPTMPDVLPTVRIPTDPSLNDMKTSDVSPPNDGKNGESSLQTDIP